MSDIYNMMRESLDTLDVVLFSGRGQLSTVMKYFQRSFWSHVGVVLRLPGVWDLVLLWESTALAGAQDVVTGTVRQGVQLVNLSERIASFDGKIAVRRLTGINRDGAFYKTLMNFRDEIKGRPYEKHVLELVRSAYDGPYGANVEDLSSLFCSELVAETMQRVGVLGEDKPSNEYTPKDFSTEGNKPLDLLGNAQLGYEIAIKE